MFFVLWLILPQTQGAILLYNSVVKPTFTDHEEEIDSALWIARERAKTTGMNWAKRGMQTLQQAWIEGYQKHDNNNNNSSETNNQSLGLNGYLQQGRAISYNLISLFYTSALSSLQQQSNDANNHEPPSPTIYSAHPVNTILPDDVFDASVSEQQAYLQEQRKQLEMMLHNLDQVEQEIQQREERANSSPSSSSAAATPSSTFYSTAPPTRTFVPDDYYSSGSIINNSAGGGRVRRRQTKVNNNRNKNASLHSDVEDGERDFESVARENDNADTYGSSNNDRLSQDREFRRQQTQALGLTSYLTGYFSRASASSST
ncbi:7923_t:CDS:2 [Ambispora gerdemannii]|uniref:7923_t:CDS:1 n=1 Tax=Ambispora gerdemannii TaxID=144530 RepID=A0A9N9DDM6_9GLOM|nr:7923_t:CDS:2 [Ambispora gerdemannii]